MCCSDAGRTAATQPPLPQGRRQQQQQQRRQELTGSASPASRTKGTTGLRVAAEGRLQLRSCGRERERGWEQQRASSWRPGIRRTSLSLSLLRSWFAPPNLLLRRPSLLLPLFLSQSLFAAATAAAPAACSGCTRVEVTDRERERSGDWSERQKQVTCRSRRRRTGE